MSDITGYFDYAAATPLDPKVKKAMDPYHTDFFYNPSAQYAPARSVNAQLKAFRAETASILGAKPTEIVFTSGATEANNLAIYGVMSLHKNANVVISALEHDSVVKPSQNFDTKICPVNSKGIVDPEVVKKLIDEKTVLVSIMLANNEIGTIQPIKKIAEIIKDTRHRRQKSDNKTPIYLHTDVAQATNYLDLHVSRLGADLMTINGGKIYGPKNSGLLFVRTGIVLKSMILGGGQERGIRSGTESLATIAGLVEALKITNKKRDAEKTRLGLLQKQFIDFLEKNITNFTINGSLKNRLPNNLHVTFHGLDNERIMMKLDYLGYCVAVGSACSASSDEPSHVLQALGMSENDIRASIRFSMGRYTTAEDIENLAKAIKTAVRA